MKNYIRPLLFLSLILLSLPSCKKEKDPVDQLPDAHTYEGEKVFGCLVNGEVWRPGGTFNSYVYTYHEPTGGLTVSGEKRNSSNNIDQLLVFSIDFFEEGNFLIDKEYPFKDFKFCPDGQGYSEYVLDTLSSHTVSIDYFSKDEGVIIGTFEFTAINNECPSKTDTVRITEGRFKASY